MVGRNEISPRDSEFAAAGGAGSEETYRPLIEKIGLQQRSIASKILNLPGTVDRGQHQKQILGAFGTLQIFDRLPEGASLEPIAPGKYTVACRISNGQPCPMADQKMDVRGIAVKFFTESGEEIDLLTTNEGGRSHARDASIFMHIADIIVENIVNGPVGFLRSSLSKWLGGVLSPIDEARAFWIILRETKLRKVETITRERFWGSVVMLGNTPAKYSLQPHESTPPGTRADRSDPNFLRTDLETRLREAPIKFALCIRFFVDEKTTPVDDASVAWPVDPAQILQIGELEIPAAPVADDEEVIRRMAFNPGHGFAPLGITHARRAVYAASALNRQALSTEETRRVFLERVSAR